jgi:hypothetical protein
MYVDVTEWKGCHGWQLEQGSGTDAGELRFIQRTSTHCSELPLQRREACAQSVPGVIQKCRLDRYVCEKIRRPHLWRTFVISQGRRGNLHSKGTSNQHLHPSTAPTSQHPDTPRLLRPLIGFAGSLHPLLPAAQSSPPWPKEPRRLVGQEHGLHNSSSSC